MNRMITSILIISAIVSCRDKRVVKHSGFDDMVVGSHTINLFDNGEFEYEMGLGYESGMYTITSDTVTLLYDDKSNLPNKFLITKDHFTAIRDTRNIKISRTDTNRTTNTKIQIPNGTYTYEIYFPEFQGPMQNRTCSVTINSSFITITQDQSTNLSGGQTMFVVT